MPIRLWLRSLLDRRRVGRELDEEFQFHLEQKIDAGIERGLSAADARAEAIQALDGIQLRKDECRDMRGFNFIDNFVRDLGTQCACCARVPHSP
jgi:hypothetical protein